MKRIKDTMAQLKELSELKGVVNKERFVSYAQAKAQLSNRKVEALWKTWDYLVNLNWYELTNVSDEIINEAMIIAREVFESVCKGAHIHWREHQPNSPKWKVYYRKGEEGSLSTMCIDLRQKEDVIKYALLLQQDDIEIIYRLDFHERVQVNFKETNNTDKEIDIYNGDIIFCSDTDRWSFSDNSGAYVCINGCYKRLMYTKGRGYLRRGEPDFEQDENGKDCRYRNYVFNSYDRHFQIVGNMYTDNSILSETNRGEGGFGSSGK